MIFNKTGNRVIVKRHRFCDSIGSKALGLMFSGRIEDFGIVFRFESEEKRALHMFFVFYPIDLLFLDRENRVVEIKEGFMPFTLYCPKKKSMSIIELPAGRAKACSLGDIITYKHCCV